MPVCYTQLKVVNACLPLTAMAQWLRQLHKLSMSHVWFLLCELLLASRRCLAKIAPMLQQCALHRCSWSNTRGMRAALKGVSFLFVIFVHCISCSYFDTIADLLVVYHCWCLLVIKQSCSICVYIANKLVCYFWQNEWIIVGDKQYLWFLQASNCSSILLLLQWHMLSVHEVKLTVCLCKLTLPLLAQFSTCLYVSFVSAFFSVYVKLFLHCLHRTAWSISVTIHSFVFVWHMLYSCSTNILHCEFIYIAPCENVEWHCSSLSESFIVSECWCGHCNW